MTRRQERSRRLDFRKLLLDVAQRGVNRLARHSAIAQLLFDQPIAARRQANPIAGKRGREGRIIEVAALREHIGHGLDITIITPLSP